MMRLIKDRRGVTAIEAAFIMPLTLMLAAGMFNYGLALVYKQQLTHAVEAAARCAALGQCASDTDTVTYATNQSALDGASFTASSENCGKQVQATYAYQLISMFPSLDLAATACYPAGAPGGGTSPGVVSVAQLPSCTSSNDGTILVATDVSTPNAAQQYYMSTVCSSGCQLSGSGTKRIPVVCDNGQWIAH